MRSKHAVKEPLCARRDSRRKGRWRSRGQVPLKLCECVRAGNGEWLTCTLLGDRWWWLQQRLPEESRRM